MQYKRFGSTVIARIDKGEEITEQLREVCRRDGINLAHISAIGALRSFTVGVFRPESRRYDARDFAGDYEIVSLSGTVTTKEGEHYAHLHLAAADGSGAVVGGHLNRAVVSATCEMVISVIDGGVNRRYDESIGLNLLEF